MLIPLGREGLKVRGGGLLTNTAMKVIFFRCLKVTSLMCWVSGGFTPLQVHLLTPLHMQYGV